VIDERRGTLIVTGASRGIGAAVAALSARDGWAVAVNYRDGQAKADAVVKDCGSGRSCACHPGRRCAGG
jgi:NAD(P)-dependent dehydrogenase (short-subunit alcohol dehydrogenase family)